MIFHSVVHLNHDYLYTVISFNYSLFLSTRHDYVYHICNALCLLRIFIDNDFKKINRRVSLQIKSYKIKNSLIKLYLFLRLRYRTLKRWNVDLLEYHLNKHSNRYLILNYKIRLFLMILIDSNSRIESYEFKIIMLYYDLLRRQASTQYLNVEILL